MKEVRFNLYENLEATNILKDSSVEEIIGMIREGNSNAALFDIIRQKRKEDPCYKAFKKALPVVTWNATFSTGKKIDDVTGTTGIIYFDKDNLSKEEVLLYKEHLASLPYVLAAWVSYGGNGLGCLIKCDNTTKENFYNLWDNINSTVGIEFDKGARSINRVNVISYDPDLRYNADAISYDYTPYTQTLSNSKNQIVYISDYSINEHIAVSTLYDTTSNSNYTISDMYSYMSFDKQFVKFKTQFNPEFFGGEKYKVFKDPIDIYQIYIPKCIPVGKRHNTLKAIAAQYFELNPLVPLEAASVYLYAINQNHCESPLPYREFNVLFRWCVKLRKENKLIAKPTPKYILFESDCGLNKTEKLRIWGKERAEIIKASTEQKILNAINQIHIAGKVITKKEVAEVINMSIRTVQRYWEKVEEYVSKLTIQ